MTLKEHVKKEIVLVIAAMTAICTMFLVPPDMKYIQYMNVPVLIELFCFMAVVAGLLKTGVFHIISGKLLSKTQDLKIIGLILTLLNFFAAMVVTNDVALLTFVPITLGLLSQCNYKSLCLIITMETVAANLGSMMTPIGNPQNLFMFSFYELTAVDFLKTMFPIGLISLVLIVGMMLMQPTINLSLPHFDVSEINKRQLSIYLSLFFLCVLTVMRVTSEWFCLIIVVAVLLTFEPKLLLQVDYSLLLTFVAFFVFTGNIARIEWVSNLLSFIHNKELICSVIISQVISNVPAAVLLSGFTNNANALMLGTNIGGLGTMVASLASLISFKLYARSDGARCWEYFKIFTLINVTFLALLLPIALVLSK